MHLSWEKMPDFEATTMCKKASVPLGEFLVAKDQETFCKSFFADTFTTNTLILWTDLVLLPFINYIYY